MRTRLLALKRDQDGTTTIEFTIVALLFFLVTFGLVEFGNLFWQYNSAAKAAQVGARLAAVSDPVWTELTSLTDDAGTPGGPWSTDYSVTCSGADGECGGSAAEYDADAMQRLVEGRDNSCGQVGADGAPGMCDIFERVSSENVLVTYAHTGLGFSGRPAGPVPTITLRLTGLTFQFVALGDLLGLGPIQMPDFLVTMTGEDLSVAAP